MVQKYNDDLKRIIRLFFGKLDPDSIDADLDEKYLNDKGMQVLHLNLDNAEKKVEELQEDIERADNRFIHFRPYFLVFISYTYSLLLKGDDSLHYAQKVHPYEWKNDWQQALSYWFLGLIYLQNNFVVEARTELVSAQNKLEMYCGISKDKYKRNKICKYLIKKIEGTLSDLPPRQKHAAPVLAGNAVNTVGGTPKETKNEGQVPVSINIHIPMDIRAISSSEPPTNKTQSDKKQGIREKEQPLDGIEVLEGTAEHVSGIDDQSYISIPNFALYGGASLSPDGIAVPSNPDFTAVNIEISSIKISNTEYRIYSIRKGDHEIPVSNEDLMSSILSPNITQQIAVKGKKYGWLNVKGNSMNNASPIAIEDEDYVLFTELRDLSSCVNKIVVAALPDGEKHEPRLMVKRLVKTGNFYFFHSESKSEKDPINGIDFTKDIEVSEANQLIGPVEAVASIKEKKVL
jgi:hypothetical protein